MSYFGGDVSSELGPREEKERERERQRKGYNFTYLNCDLVYVTQLDCNPVLKKKALVVLCFVSFRLVSVDLHNNNS